MSNKQSEQKLAKDINKHTFKEDILISKEHMKRCSASLIIREKQLKTAVSDHLTLVKMATIKKSTNNKCWRGYGEKRTLLHCSEDVKLVQSL